MPSAPSSTIRAYAQWRSSSVYAGDDIECVITFRNIATIPKPNQEDNTYIGHSNDELRERRSPRLGSTVKSKGTSTIQTRPDHARALSMTSNKTNATRGHRSTLSLNVVSAPLRTRMQSGAGSGPPPRGHGRSLSIISLRSDVINENTAPAALPIGRTKTRSHTRSASLQYLPNPPSPADAFSRGLSPRLPSPLAEAATSPNSQEHGPEETSARSVRQRPTLRTVYQSDQGPRNRRMPSEGFNPDFQFPARPAPESPSPLTERATPKRTPLTMHSGQNRGLALRHIEKWDEGSLSNINPITRVMSEASTNNESPRTSVELYSTSDHSEDTFMSDSQQGLQGESHPSIPISHSRQATVTQLSELHGATKAETLMMGSIQTQGHFSLDGSLVNAAPFDEIKRKGVQSGGVVGMERSKRSSGIFGALSWGNIGESLGGLLGNDEMSSLAQMKASAGSKTIPLLSTPQTLLFVDLTLAPGESRSYSYSFPMPRGLPPTHRGRAIKIEYHLVLSIQRSGVQAIQRVQIPFRLLGSYNHKGEILGHDLMSPYILLRDTARTSNVSQGELPWLKRPAPQSQPQIQPQAATDMASDKGLEDFLRYTARLLGQSTEQPGVLLSPTSPHGALPSPSNSRQGSLVDHLPLSIREAIDLAILRSNQSSSPDPQRLLEGHSSNRFNIARSGQPVAVLTLLRPSFRLGEVVFGSFSFDFSRDPNASQPTTASTYFISVELESAERVDSSLAMRSTHSINRVTRKVHAISQGTAIFAKRMSFHLPIPASATPTFETTGVSLSWRLRILFTTRRRPGVIEADDDTSSPWDTIGSDGKKIALVAKERLPAETFEVAVPVRVYGIPGVNGLSGTSDPLVV